MKPEDIFYSKHLVAEARVLSSPFSQAWGLMFQKPKAVVMPFKKSRILSVHMIFCFWPLDLIFLDKDKKVVEIKEYIMPFQFYTSKKRVSYLIELPAGSVKKHKFKINSQLSFKPHTR